MTGNKTVIGKICHLPKTGCGGLFIGTYSSIPLSPWHQKKHSGVRTRLKPRPYYRGYLAVFIIAAHV